MNIYIDIETIPAQNPDIKSAIAAEVKAPGQYKKKESIDEWLAENRDKVAEEDWRKTSFDGGLGHVVVISAAVGDGETKTFYSTEWQHPEYEAELLREFFAFLHVSFDPSRQIPPTFIGHNVADFDLRFLFQRAVVLGVAPPRFLPVNVRSWDKSIFDTMNAWAGYNGRVSLEKLCKVLGIAGKGSEIGEEIDGSKVWDFVRDGKIDKVAKYCAADVERVRNIFKRMTFSDAA
ncbi:hypothetical protein [Pectobacterium odoriferum]|uniref:hypothetical protein n=1 Tax=Pectobacterium odoriferum TaxID=78398 RepID=UPI000507F3F6|nr:hypothetical protein [Pectobacterium odoriferum]KGA31157.1 hypothetical protein KS43_19675 [Pectobacterium odoriferum]